MISLTNDLARGLILMLYLIVLYMAFVLGLLVQGLISAIQKGEKKKCLYTVKNPGSNNHESWVYFLIPSN